MAKSASFEGAVAVVTGAGSGIGKALALELSARGATLYLSDIDEQAVRALAEQIGGQTRARALDVRDAAEVQAYVSQVEHEAGRIDYLFNNAGVAITGEVFDLTLAHWERVIDVNLRGVVHGVHAAYPGMVARGSGHIVNTASMAGLGPAPLATPYSATKHAVVGLSTSLRLEAEAYGVRVSALCPGVIETPLLDKPNPSDLPKLGWLPDGRDFVVRAAGKPYPVQKLASDALDAVLKNEAVIVIPAFARWGMRLVRHAPAMFEAHVRKVLAFARKSDGRASKAAPPLASES